VRVVFKDIMHDFSRQKGVDYVADVRLMLTSGEYAWTHGGGGHMKISRRNAITGTNPYCW